MKNVFLVGPGSAGKTTVAPLVAALTSRRAADLDGRFTEAYGEITGSIAGQGYRAYCESNSALAERIVHESSEDLVIATSSGFLAHDGCDDIVERNVALIRRTGRSVCLLPHEDVDRAARILAFRQIRRYPDRDLAAEYTIAHDRIGRYLAAADHVVVSADDPRDTAHLVAARLLTGPLEVVGRPIAGNPARTTV